MYNKIIVMGRVASVPELKVTPNGTNVCRFRVAVDRRFQAKGEEKQTDFFNVTAWRQTGEFVSKYFSKGRMILIEGEMQTQQYTDKNGNQATWYEINAERASFTGEKADSAGATAYAPNAPASAPTTSQSAQAQAVNAAVGYEDDYPF